MKNYERIITVGGKDTGVRENNRGSLYINHKVFFSDPKVIRILKRLSKSKLVSKNK